MQKGEEYSEAAEECRRLVVEDALAAPLIAAFGLHVDSDAP